MERRRERGAASLCPGRVTGRRRGRRQMDSGAVESRRRDAGREISRRKASRRPWSTISSANCPWEQDGGPADVTPQAPEFQAPPAANQRRPGGLAGPLPASAARAARAPVAAAASWARVSLFLWELGSPRAACRAQFGCCGCWAWGPGLPSRNRARESSPDDVCACRVAPKPRAVCGASRGHRFKVLWKGWRPSRLHGIAMQGPFCPPSRCAVRAEALLAPKFMKL